MKTVIAVRHLSFENLGVWEPALASAGFEVRYCDPVREDLTAIDAASPDLLVVLGAPIGAFDDEFYPFLAGEVDLIERRLASGRPLLGICLGAQLIARALGAGVAPMTEKEIGFGGLTLAASSQSSVLRELDGWPVLHWHGDQFDIPDGATLLASSQHCRHQAFSVGPNVLALQCHLEADPDEIEAWLIGHCAELTASGCDPRTIRLDAERFGPTLAVRARKVLSAWIDGWDGQGPAVRDLAVSRAD